MVNDQIYTKANQPGILIEGEPAIRLIKDIKQNNEIVGKIYEISVTLVNTGIDITDELTVNLTDEEHFSLSKKIMLNYSETKTVSFNWSTLLIKDQQIIISFYPTDQDTDLNQYNSGSKTFTIHMTDVQGIRSTSTPGFEAVLIITAILIVVFLMKKQNIRF